MEKQLIARQYATKMNASFSQQQAFTEIFSPENNAPAEMQPKKMRVLFSGCGKAEKDMGSAPLPSLWNPAPSSWKN